MSSAAKSGKNPFQHVEYVHQRTTLERLDKFLSNVYFTDVNLYGRLYKKTKPVKLLHYGPTSRHARQQLIDESFKEIEINHSFGPTFSTHWFKVVIELPSSWDNEKVVFLWDSGCEVMIWKGHEPVNSLMSEEILGVKKYYTIAESLSKDDPHEITLYLEVACNRLLGEGKNGLVNPPDMKKMFAVTRAEVAVFDAEAWNMFHDLSILLGIADTLPQDNMQGNKALLVANRAINELVTSNFAKGDKNMGYEKAKVITRTFLNNESCNNKLTIHAWGHCHIDSAWLWQYSETVRKCGRSWISVLSLMEKYKDFKFTCSQAQQYEWVKEHYPTIYSKLTEYVKRGQFLPVGGTWVEMDGNLPNGESMVRQFVFGQRYFRKEFGGTCNEFWLPDTFGYSANLPQIMQEAGITNFLTQKLSWNLVNKFPHTTFYWEGIDGSSVLSHFPPGNNYAMNGLPKEIIATQNNFKEKHRINDCAYLFGLGDGGGGPTEDMIERLERMDNCSDLPGIKMTTPDELFTKIRTEANGQLHTWVGELFLEMHNGTYTTQAMIKKYNRKCEVLLHDVEFAATLAWLISDRKFEYPQSQIDDLWKLLLLNQFHDVLPGSSIELVNEDAIEYFKTITEKGELLFKELLKQFMDNNDTNESSVVNTLPWDRKAVVELNDKSKKLITVPGLSIATVNEDALYKPVTVDMQEDGSAILQNNFIFCKIDKCGRITSLKMNGSQQEEKELVKNGCFGNQFVLFDDVPLFWDAWDVMDYHLETRTPVLEILKPLKCIESTDGLVGVLTFKVKVGENSVLSQTVKLGAESKFIEFINEVDWHETHKFLKVEFPWQLHSPKATYEIQFGHLERPTHQNTSWDTARYEVWAHKWADYSQYDIGVAIINDCKYGYSAFGNIMRLSLLRSPKAPDANADIGHHSFTYAVMPHKGSFQEASVIQAAYELNYPLHVISGNKKNISGFLNVDKSAIVCETIKKSDTHSDAVLIRLYESFGSSTMNTKITFPERSINKVQRCNLLEDIKEEHVQINENYFCTSFDPFQFKTFLVWFK